MSEREIRLPAFACAAENGHQEGMAMRDYFASAAMQGLCACPEVDMTIKDLAEWAYTMADAMLKARIEDEVVA